jgi:hypothetical protein
MADTTTLPTAAPKIGTVVADFSKKIKEVDPSDVVQPGQTTQGRYPVASGLPVAPQVPQPTEPSQIAPQSSKVPGGDVVTGTPPQAPQVPRPGQMVDAQNAPIAEIVRNVDDPIEKARLDAIQAEKKQWEQNAAALIDQQNKDAFDIAQEKQRIDEKEAATLEEISRQKEAIHKKALADYENSYSALMESKPDALFGGWAGQTAVGLSLALSGNLDKGMSVIDSAITQRDTQFKSKVDAMKNKMEASKDFSEGANTILERAEKEIHVRRAAMYGLLEKKAAQVLRARGLDPAKNAAYVEFQMKHNAEAAKAQAEVVEKTRHKLTQEMVKVAGGGVGGDGGGLKNTEQSLDKQVQLQSYIDSMKTAQSLLNKWSQATSKDQKNEAAMAYNSYVMQSVLPLKSVAQEMGALNSFDVASAGVLDEGAGNEFAKQESFIKGLSASLMSTVKDAMDSNTKIYSVLSKNTYPKLIEDAQKALDSRNAAHKPSKPGRGAPPPPPPPPPPPEKPYQGNRRLSVQDLQDKMSRSKR